MLCVVQCIIYQFLISDTPKAVHSFGHYDDVRLTLCIYFKLYSCFWK